MQYAKFYAVRFCFSIYSYCNDPRIPKGIRGFVVPTIHTCNFMKKGVDEMEKRIGFIGIIVEDKNQVKTLNELLSQYGHLILGRMGIPHHGAVNVIVVIIEGNNDEIGALTGKLGSIKGILVRSALSSYAIPSDETV